MKYKVGDKVQVKTWETLVQEFKLVKGDILHHTNKHELRVVMAKYCNHIITIEEVREYWYYIEEEKESGIQHPWCDWMFQDSNDNNLSFVEDTIRVEIGLYPYNIRNGEEIVQQ